METVQLPPTPPTPTAGSTPTPGTGVTNFGDSPAFGTLLQAEATRSRPDGTSATQSSRSSGTTAALEPGSDAPDASQKGASAGNQKAAGGDQSQQMMSVLASPLVAALLTQSPTQTSDTKADGVGSTIEGAPPAASAVDTGGVPTLSTSTTAVLAGMSSGGKTLVGPTGGNSAALPSAAIPGGVTGDNPVAASPAAELAATGSNKPAARSTVDGIGSLSLSEAAATPAKSGSPPSGSLSAGPAILSSGTSGGEATAAHRDSAASATATGPATAKTSGDSSTVVPGPDQAGQAAVGKAPDVHADTGASIDQVMSANPLNASQDGTAATPVSIASAEPDYLPALGSGREDLLKQLATQVGRLNPSSSPNLRVQLKPAYLGSVDLNLSMQDGVLALSIRTELTHTRDMIEAALPQLRHALAGRGMDAPQVSLSSLGTSGAATDFIAQGSWGGDQGTGSWYRTPTRTFANAPQGLEQPVVREALASSHLVDYTV